jgi:hypothetical protein
LAGCERGDQCGTTPELTGEVRRVAASQRVAARVLDGVVAEQVEPGNGAGFVAALAARLVQPADESFGGAHALERREVDGREVCVAK